MFARRSNVLVALGALALVGGLVLSGYAPAVEAAQTNPGQPQAGTVTVVGRGEVKARPDVANTTVGVEVLASTVDQAMDDAKARMDAILAALKGLGIAEKDIQTSNFSINFERQNPEPLPRPEPTPAQPGAVQPPAGFYRVSNMVQVTIRDLDEVGTVLEAAVKAGANNIWGITFALSDTKGLETQAREAAVKDARSRAESLAGLTGVALGKVVAVSEVIGNTPGPVFADAAKAFGGGAAPIEPGEVTFSTQIQVVYAIQ